MYEVINFVFKSKTPRRIGFSKTIIYWTSKRCGRSYFTRKTLINAISFLITKYCITIRNLLFKPEIDIPVGIDLVPYWESLFLNFLNQNMFSNQYLKDLHHLPISFMWHQGLYTTFAQYDGEFSSSWKYI